MTEKDKFFVKKKMKQKGDNPKMNKELLICIFILIVIIILDVMTYNSTNHALEQVSAKLNELREEMIKEEVNHEQCKKKMDEIHQIWKQQEHRLACYIEHDELEKIGVELTKLNADIETKEYSTGVENLDNCVFLLEHIKEKHALKMINIF